MRYEALLTTRQLEILTLCDDEIQTIPRLHRAFWELNLDFGMAPVSRESLYISLTILERRGLVIRNDGAWPHEWTATDEGKEALEITENTDLLRPSRIR